jgi:L-lactate dehydrogenase complex protein LldE
MHGTPLAREQLSVRIGLFIPCYVDQLFPEVGFAALRLLEQHSVDVAVMDAPSCCGQPLINSGAVEAARDLADSFAQGSQGFDAIVTPSGSCVTILRTNPARYSQAVADPKTPPQVYELTQFLVEVLGVRRVQARFERRVGVLRSCHALRGLRLGRCSERPHAGHAADVSPAEFLLDSVQGIEVVEAHRVDECCGFGGSFSVLEPDISTKMGLDRLRDFELAGAEVITSTDVSCLMHLDGLARSGGLAVRTLHVAQILAGEAA